MADPKSSVDPKSMEAFGNRDVLMLLCGYYYFFCVEILLFRDAIFIVK